MRRRIFIAINLDAPTKKFISGKLSRWQEQLPLKWTDSENYHLTLNFIGLVEDARIEEIIESLHEYLENYEAFDLTLDEIDWGPKKEKPKMLWLKGQPNQQLIELRSLVEASITGTKEEERKFSPHVTLGRLISAAKKESLSDPFQKTNILVPVISVDVMESVVEKGKRRYLLLESIALA